MPLINSAYGKLDSLMVVDDKGDLNTINFVFSLAAATGAQMVYYLISRDTVQPTNIRYLSNKPPNVTYLIEDSNKGFSPNRIKSRWSTADLAIGTVTRSSKPLLFLSAQMRSHKKVLDQLLHSFDITYTNGRDIYFIQSGDFIAGTDFIIIGPNTYHQRKTLMASKSYWPGFFKRYGYTGFKKKNVLTIAFDTRFKIVWDVILYHLDLYLNYTGIDEDGNHRFYLGELTEQFILSESDKNRRAKYRLINRFLLKVFYQLDSFFGENLIIERLPLVLDAEDSVFTFNNALVEITEKQVKYYIPRYKFENVKEPLLSQINNAYWDAVKIISLRFGAGIIPIDVPDSDVVADKQSLHCIASVLQRG